METTETHDTADERMERTLSDASTTSKRGLCGERGRNKKLRLRGMEYTGIKRIKEGVYESSVKKARKMGERCGHTQLSPVSTGPILILPKFGQCPNFGTDHAQIIKLYQ